MEKRDGETTGLSLQDQQQALMAAIQAEPDTAAVIDALQSIYAFIPTPAVASVTKSYFGTGANALA